MSRSKKQRKRGGTPPPPQETPHPLDIALGANTGTWAAGAGVALCIVLTWLSRWALNTDGVAYLDLARAARSGDWEGLVQGYWSPLYPVLLGVLLAVTDGTRTTLIVLSHVVNGAATIAGIALLWWWGRRSARPYFSAALIATFLVASTGLPRIEAVTPDVLLLTLMAWVGYELLHHRGERVVPTGVALGLSFLAKTSVWPWLLLSVPLRIWGAEGPEGRRRTLLSSGVAFLVAALWVVPLSREAGRPTLGSAGKLNYSWYIEGSDARSPDTHRGRHQAAKSIAIDSARSVEFFTFTDGGRWTYAPWSDPTAWSAGILTSNARPPRISDLAAYWGRQAGITFGYWILPALLGVVVPCAIAFRAGGVGRRRFREERAHIALLILALAGILQFIAVHAEPRLIAPFVLLFGVTALDLVFTTADQRGGGASARMIALAITWVAVFGLSGVRIVTWLEAGPRIAAATDRILAGQAAPLAGAPRPREILVVGPAMSVAPAAFIAGVRIVAQLPPAAQRIAQTLPTDQQDSLLIRAGGGRLRAAWITDQMGGVSVVAIPTP